MNSLYQVLLSSQTVVNRKRTKSRLYGGEDDFQYSTTLALGLKGQAITMSVNVLFKIIYLSILLCSAVQGKIIESYILNAMLENMI